MEEYCNKKNSTYSIANIVGCSVKCVCNYLEYFGIKRQNNKHIKPGDKFGLLETLEIVNKSKNGTYNWKCKCECGNETIVPTSRLKIGRCKSCGCYRKRRKNHRWTGYCDISGTRISDIRCRAKRKNIEFNLDAKFLWELFIYQNKKCAISGVDLFIDNNASLDRIDSSLGYTKDNVQWVSITVNKMKLDFGLNYFIKTCEIITNFQKGDKNAMATAPCA